MGCSILIKENICLIIETCFYTLPVCTQPVPDTNHMTYGSQRCDEQLSISIAPRMAESKCETCPSRNIPIIENRCLIMGFQSLIIENLLSDNRNFVSDHRKSQIFDFNIKSLRNMCD